MEGVVQPIDCQPAHEEQDGRDRETDRRMGSPEGAQKGTSLPPPPAQESPDRSPPRAMGSAMTRRTMMCTGRHAGRVAENSEEVFREMETASDAFARCSAFLVAVDGFEYSHRAVEYVGSLLRGTNAASGRRARNLSNEATLRRRRDGSTVPRWQGLGDLDH